MAPKKQKAAVARAPASMEPVFTSRKRNGQPTRAAKKDINKVVHSVLQKVAQEDVRQETARYKAAVLEATSDVVYEGEYTAELGQKLFALCATGVSLDGITSIPGMPSLFTLLTWIAEPTHEFSRLYGRAKSLLISLYEERAQLAAVQPEEFVIKTRKQVLTKDGEVVWVTEKKIVDNVARSALKLDAYKWTLAHLLPKKHGRNPDTLGDKPNEQLEGLFAALKAGPKE